VAGAGDILVGAGSARGPLTCLDGDPIARKKGETDMNNIFYIVGVVVVVLFVAGYFGLR